MAGAQRSELIAAPAWHTALLLVGLVAGAGAEAAARLQHAAAASDPSVVYIRLLIGSVGFAVFASGLGVRRGVFGKAWGGAASLPTDVLTAALLFVSVLCTAALTSEGTVGAAAILPSTPQQKAWWTIVAIVVPCCEELVYRGYLLRQLARLLGAPWLGIAAQAALFGAAHLAQGVAQATLIGGYGALFGWVALRRGNLVACTLCHISIDIYAGLAG